MKVLCATVAATFVCAACHADELTKKDVKDLLETNNQILTGTMRENTDSLKRAISEDNDKLIKVISDSSATLGKNLTEAIERLGTRIESPNSDSISNSVPMPPQRIYVHKTVRHIYIHKYAFCHRVIWDEEPCCWSW